MLFAFQRKRRGCLLIFYNIIYHGKAPFSSARMRVCEEKNEKKTKIAGNGFCRRFDAMFRNKNFAKNENGRG